jgi:hypothetical protein
MSNCSGCFPHYQENQMAHMEVGGCLYEDVLEFCQPINLGSLFDRIATEDDRRALSPEPEQVQEEVPVQQNTKVYTNDDECVICYEEIGKTNNCVTPCGHAFCFKCLVSAMVTKNTCPCCRTELFNLPKEEEEDEDEDDDYDESDDEESEDGDGLIPVETLVARLEARGFTMLDVVSMLSNNYSKTNPKYTGEYIMNMCNTYDDVITEIENEHDEQVKFAEEDTRTRENNCA